MRTQIGALGLASFLVLFNGSNTNASVVADSVADFSSSQGANGWFYGYYNKTTDSNQTYDYQTDFQLLPSYLTNGQFSSAVGPAWELQDGTFWTSLWSTGGHGNGLITSGGRTPQEQFPIRRWISTVNGTINISGNLAKFDPNSTSNGIVGNILIDGTDVYTQFIAGTDTTGVNYSINANVSVGSIIDFQLDPFQANDLGDATQFNAVVATVPEPAVLSMLCLPALFALRRRRR